MQSIREIIRRPAFIKGALSVLVACSVYFLLPPDCPEAARRTAVVFVIAALFWALEILPLWATSLVIVLLLIFTLGKPDGVLGMKKEGYTVFLVPFSSPIIMLFFSGFMISAAMEKYHIDKELVSGMLRRFGRNPYRILLGFMAVTGFVSMWMSNTAATAIMIAMAKPVFDLLDTDDPFKAALVLSIPFAANIGGMGTPIGTPPNAIAVGLLAAKGVHLSFLSWMLMAIPLVVLMTLIISWLLIVMFRPKHTHVDLKIEKKHALGNQARLVIAIFALTVVLWITSEFHGIPEALTALLAVGLLVGTGLLGKQDLRDVEWDVLVLMWGGLAIGKAMELSGLATWFVGLPFFSHTGFLLIIILMVLALVLSEFMSNTAVANLMLPIALSFQHENLVVLGIVVALGTSFAMALPISTPPNAIAFAEGSIRSRDMLKSGAVIGVIGMIVMAVGFHFVIPFAFGLK